MFCGYYTFVFNHCDVIGQQSNRIQRKTQNKGYYVVKGRSRLSRSVPIKNSYATSYWWLIVTDILGLSLSQSIVQILDTLRFASHLNLQRGSLGAKYDVHLTGKRVVDFLLLLIELFR